ncbi:DUF4142 domain-containing protein [Hymenobacter sp. CRA2]|uniref:DUF4142 domain-containing protein n=1 Tax=Hymenobacter sp. CRA2 TaxID=1955620 RepID=UPI00098FCB0E|nr:DUF4142 domain-containing protein [Hymenobacter sp. CRA2]OON70774.1 hypothetical protein B0919_01815 [Hymenobacter sp. CRA2]
MLVAARFLLLTLPVALLACGTGERDPVADAKFENEQRINREDITKRQEQDADFMVEAAIRSRLVAELGQLAQRRATLPGLRNFGQQLTREQNSLGAALRNLAGQKSLTLPEGLSEDQQEELQKLAGLSGAEFDREWLSQATDQLDDAQEAFDDMGDDAYDGDIRAIAAKYAPTLKTTYEQADQLTDQLPKQ